MSIYEYFYDFFGQLLGDTVISTEIGTIFATYGSYLCVAFLVWGFFAVFLNLCKGIRSIF